ncbi:MAG TPA: amidohydrolase family protein [Chitinophagaceae bacterium]|nr:amidohydrolase family protein [Chitinophagaceae bacterium]
MKKSAFLVLVLLITLNLLSQKTYIWCGTLIDGVSVEPRKNMTIVVEKNKITAVQAGFTMAGVSDKTIDLKTKTVTPGWMDMHVHMEHETNPNRYLETYTFNPADYAFQSVKYAEITLMAGFTTVRDLGGSGVNISLRNAINKGIIKGPRVFTAGKSIATTGGHADPTNGYKKELMGDPGPAEGVANGTEECRQAVRQRYKDGSDLIKITATGGVLSVAKSGKNPQFFEDEIEAIVKTAKDYGFKVAVHAHGEEGMKRAIRAGVNSIEHGTFMDDETIELFKKHGTWYVPTITAGKAVGDSAKIPGYYPPVVVPKALETGPQIQKTFAKAYKAGVKIAFGTDAGVYKHGMNWLEFGYMIEAGMTPMDAIKSATINAADLLGEKDKLGSIEAGKLADIVALDGDPLKDSKAFGKVVFVMKDGMVYKQ